jgi:Fe-Mn family superoxide dismutase
MSFSRRNFLFFLGAATTVSALDVFGEMPSFAQSQTSAEGPFEVIPLAYDYKALEPYIDAETMRFHHDKHYATYTKKLNAAVAQYPQLANKSAEELVTTLNRVPTAIRKTIRDNGGGYVNHSMFWEIMGPNGGGEPTGELAQAIQDTFGSFADFQTQFNDAGGSQFGSGWAWLVLDKSKQLKVTSTPNQDSPLTARMYPIMGNDVWEHAYYLKYRNERTKYLEEWWNVVNWDAVSKRYQQAMTG